MVKFPSHMNLKDTWAIIDVNGKILAKYRLRYSAMKAVPKFQAYREKLRVVELNEKGEVLSQ